MQFLSNLSKIILSQKTADIILSMLTLLVFFKTLTPPPPSPPHPPKEKKMTKIVKIEEVKIHIFVETWWVSLKNTKLYTPFREYIFSNFFKYIVGVKAWTFSKWTLEILPGKSLGKRYNAWYMLFRICPRTSRTPKIWHTYGDFRVIAEPW